MAKNKGYYKSKAYRGYLSSVKRWKKAGRYRTTCKKITRTFCFTTRGKPVSCKGAIGKQYKRPIRRSFYRCVDAVSKRFAPSSLCPRSCKRG